MFMYKNTDKNLILIMNDDYNMDFKHVAMIVLSFVI